MTEIKVLDHDLNERNLKGFFYSSDYGWCFFWYEEETCDGYGIFPSDFISVTEGINENSFTDWIKSLPKNKCTEFNIEEYYKFSKS